MNLLRRILSRGPSPSGTLARVVENTAWLLSAKGIGAVLSLFYLALATRTLGIHGFGQFILVLGTAQAVSAFVQFQTWQIVLRYGMEHHNAARSGELSRLIAFAGALDLASALIGCGVAALVVTFLGPYFGWDRELGQAALAFCIVVLLSIRSTAMGILRLHDRFAVAAAADAVIPVMRLLGALAVVAIGASVTGFLIAWAASEVAAAIVYWVFAARVARGSFRWPGLGGIRQVPAEHPGLWRFAAITNAGATIDLGAKQVTVIAVGIFAGPAAAGGYRLAWQLGQALAKVTEALSRAVFAEITRVNFGDLRANLPRLFRNATRFAFIAAVVIVILLLLIGKPVLGLIAGPEFLSAYPLLVLLGTAAALDLGAVAFEPTLIATDRAWTALRLRAAVAILLLASLPFLLQAHGPWGAAFATLCAAAASLLMLGIAARRTVLKADQP